MPTAGQEPGSPDMASCERPTSNNRYPSGASAVTRALSMTPTPEQNCFEPDRHQPSATGCALVRWEGERAAHTPYEAVGYRSVRAASSRIARASKWPSVSRATERSTSAHALKDSKRCAVSPDPGSGKSDEQFRTSSRKVSATGKLSEVGRCRTSISSVQGRVFRRGPCPASTASNAALRRKIDVDRAEALRPERTLREERRIGGPAARSTKVTVNRTSSGGSQRIDNTQGGSAKSGMPYGRGRSRTSKERGEARSSRPSASQPDAPTFWKRSRFSDACFRRPKRMLWSRLLKSMVAESRK